MRPNGNGMACRTHAYCGCSCDITFRAYIPRQMVLRVGGGRDAVLLCYNTGRTYEARLPNTFQPHTFLISLVRTAKSQLWPMRRWVGDALSNP